MQSLKEIATEYGVTPQAALNWKVAAEARTGRSFTPTPDPGDKRRVLYSPADVAEITKGKRPKSTTAEAATETTEPAPIEVIEGNHRRVLSAPIVPATVDLGQFRGGSEIAAYEDPLQAIQGALALTRATRQAMGQDLSNRLALYQQTEAAAAQLESEVEALKAEQIRYRVESDLLGILQSQQTATLQKHLGKVQALGGDGQG